MEPRGALIKKRNNDIKFIQYTVSRIKKNDKKKTLFLSNDGLRAHKDRRSFTKNKLLRNQSLLGREYMTKKLIRAITIGILCFYF